MIIEPINVEAAQHRVAELQRQLDEAREQEFWARVDDKVNSELKNSHLYADMKYDGTVSLRYGVENVEAEKETSLEWLVQDCISTYDDRMRVESLKSELLRLVTLVEQELDSRRED